VTPIEPDRLFTVAQVCDRLSVSRRTFYNLVAQGELRPVKIGRRTMLRGSELTRYLDMLDTVAETQQARP
jgi:excisionase family DNA binding protein